MYLRKGYLEAADSKTAQRITTIETSLAGLYARRTETKAEYRLEKKEINELIDKAILDLDQIADNMSAEEQSYEDQVRQGEWMAAGLEKTEKERYEEQLQREAQQEGDQPKVDFAGNPAGTTYAEVDTEPPPPPRATGWGQRQRRMLGDSGIAKARKSGGAAIGSGMGSAVSGLTKNARAEIFGSKPAEPKDIR